MKLPSLQFYPADWRKDPGVQALSYHDRGVWFEILCLMHESEQRGKLTLNGKPMPEDALARLLGLDKQNLTKVISLLLEYGVASRDDAGCLMNRRMVKDEEIRKLRAEVGQKGGNQRIENEKIKDLLKQNSSKSLKQVKQNSTPSSSSSFTERKEDVVQEKNPPGERPVKYAIAGEGFDSLTDYLSENYSLLLISFQDQYPLKVVEAFFADFSKRNLLKIWVSHDDFRKHLIDAMKKFNELNGERILALADKKPLVHQDVTAGLKPLSATLNGKH